MKLAFQQYKPSRWQYALGIAGLLGTITAIGIIILYNCTNIPVSFVIYDISLRCIGVGAVLALAFLPVRMLVITLGTKNCTMHLEHRFAFLRIPMPKKPLPEFDYICAFSQLQGDEDNEGNASYSYIYDVNAWYGNKHIKLCSQYTAEEAMRVATKVALALNCELLDATNPADKIWITLPAKHEADTNPTETYSQQI
jgi:hypothetical protein